MKLYANICFSACLCHCGVCFYLLLCSKTLYIQVCLYCGRNPTDHWPDINTSLFSVVRVNVRTQRKDLSVFSSSCLKERTGGVFTFAVVSHAVIERSGSFFFPRRVRIILRISLLYLGSSKGGASEGEE